MRACCPGTTRGMRARQWRVCTTSSRLHTLDAPPAIAAFRRGYRGAARPVAPVRNRFGYVTERTPGLQQHVNEFNTLVFTLKIFDTSLVRLYVLELPVSSAARLAVAAV